MTISYNIGYAGIIGPNVLTFFPTTHVVENSEEFVKLLRSLEFVEGIFNFMTSKKVITSAACLFLTITDKGNTRKVLIKLINVREYRNYWEKSVGKEWEVVSKNNDVPLRKRKSELNFV
jgi:hypothetical protein